MRKIVPGHVLNIAHRGASHDAPENTLFAFRLAFAQGADGVELDVRLSADGQAVVHHDADLKRTAGRADRISDLTAEALARVRLEGPGESRTVGIPTLGEVVADLPPDALLDVEVKSSNGEDDRLVRCALRAAGGRIGPTLFTSSEAPTLERLRAVSPAARLGLIVRDRTGPPPWHLAARLNAGTLVVNRNALDDPLLARARDEGLQVYPYTVDTAAEVRALALRGVGGIITNRPDVAARALRHPDGS